MKMIKLKEETHEKLLSLGSKGETFDDIINRLMEKGKRQ